MGSLDKNYVVSKIRQRLNDQFRQKYNSKVDEVFYLNNLKYLNHNSEYGKKNYLTDIKSPDIRAKLANMRMCGSPSFKREMYSPDYTNSICSKCNLNVPRSIKHWTLYCNCNAIKVAQKNVYDITCICKYEAFSLPESPHF